MAISGALDPGPSLGQGYDQLDSGWIMSTRDLSSLGCLSLIAMQILTASGARNSTGESLPVHRGELGEDFSVLEHHNGPTRSGVYTHPSFTRSAAAGIHLEFSAPIAGVVLAQPLFLDGRGKDPDTVLVVTELNQVFAINGSTGTQIWNRVLDPPVPRQVVRDLIGNSCGNIDPIGITGTPVIDENARRIYFNLFTSDETRHAKHLAYSLSLDDGSTVPGWPVDVGASVPGFRDLVQNQRGALTLLNGRVYVPYGGHVTDCADYRGWVVGISTDGTSVSAWSTGVIGAGIWGPSGVASDGKSVFVVTGNALEFAKWSGSEAIIRLGDGPTFTALPADYYAPLDWETLDALDLDLGGSGAILVDVPGAKPQGLVAALGKDGKVYLADRSNLGGIGGGLLAELVAPAGIATAPSAYTTSRGTYLSFTNYGAKGIHCPGENVVAIQILPTSPLSISTSWCANIPGYGSTMVTTSDGTSESIVWVAGAKADNRLYGLDGDTGALITTANVDGYVTEFSAPIAAKGRIYLGAADQLLAFTLN